MVGRVLTIPEAASELLQCVGRAAADLGLKSFLVGGPVRDMLLERELVDLDLMVTGDALGFTTEIFQQWDKYFASFPRPEPPRHFAKFGTAKLSFTQEVIPTVVQLDFSSARKEVYPHPGAQPIVEPGSVMQDLARRDFSINAMAVSLHPTSWGQLEDDFSGERDLANGELKVLHRQSFEDDPARLLRAVRFMARFGFTLEEPTKLLFEGAVARRMLGKLPPFRLFSELKKTLQELLITEVLQQLSQSGVLASIDSRLEVGPELRNYMQQIQGLGQEADSGLILGLLAAKLTDLQYTEWLLTLSCSKKQCRALVSLRSGRIGNAS